MRIQRRSINNWPNTYMKADFRKKKLEFHIETHHLFIDFKTAYDKVNLNQLYKAMLELGIPPKLVRLPQATMEGTTAKVNP